MQPRGFPLPPPPGGMLPPPPGALPMPPRGMPFAPMPGMPGMPMPGMGMPVPGMPFAPQMVPGMMPPMMHPGMPPAFPPGVHGFPPMAPPAMPFRPPVAMAPPTAAIVGAPVLSVPPSSSASGASISAPPTSASSTANCNLFNLQNLGAAFVNATSDALNKSIFQNPLAALPLSLYVGNIPLDLEDSSLLSLFGTCGKLARVVRPTDPKSMLPSTLAFITYTQAICALRAHTLLDGVVVNDRGDKIVVRCGTKETDLLNSVRESEREAAKNLPENMSLDDVHRPILRVVESLLAPPPALTVPPVATNEPAPELQVPKEAKKETEHDSTAMPLAPAALFSLVQINKEAVLEGAQPTIDMVDQEGERFLLTEIEKFRQRQQQRDQELDVQRRIKIKQRLAEIAAQKQREMERQAEEKNKPKEQKETEPEKEKEREEDRESLDPEAKRRRLQVIASLSESQMAPLPEVPAGPIRVPLSLAAPAPGVSGSVKTKRVFGEERDDEEREERERMREREQALQRLREEQAREKEREGQEPAREEGEEEEEGPVVPAKKAPAPVKRTKEEQEKHDKELAKKALDSVPTDMNRVFSHPVNWSLLEKNNVLTARLLPWVSNKIEALLGEEEAALSVFIMAQLSNRTSPANLQTELQAVLDADAVPLVEKLWRLIVFYSILSELQDQEQRQ